MRFDVGRRARSWAGEDRRRRRGREQQRRERDWRDVGGSVRGGQVRVTVPNAPRNDLSSIFASLELVNFRRGDEAVPCRVLEGRRNSFSAAEKAISAEASVSCSSTYSLGMEPGQSRKDCVVVYSCRGEENPPSGPYLASDSFPDDARRRAVSTASLQSCRHCPSLLLLGDSVAPNQYQSLLPQIRTARKK